MKLSVLITCLDDHVEVNATIASLRATSPADVECIVVDDFSQPAILLDDKSAVLVRNEFRAGVAASRHIAASRCTGNWMLIVDAHMRFAPGWYEAALAAIEKATDKTLLCGACVALSPSNMDISKAKVEYHGASINFYGKDRNNPALTQFIEGIWLPSRPGDNYEIPCIMGACYLMPVDFFFHVGGLRLLKQWGYDEPFLAIKWWLAGGEIRMAKSIRIGHQFRQTSTYKSDNWALWYNRLVMVHTLFPKDKIWPFVHLLPPTREVVEAKNRIEQDANIILSERALYQTAFVHDLPWYLKKFNLQLGV